jgi:hypothetical protein
MEASGTKVETGGHNYKSPRTTKGASNVGRMSEWSDFFKGHHSQVCFNSAQIFQMIYFCLI